MANNRNFSVEISGIGTALAAVMSYIHNHSIVWAIIHAFCGWIYVAYAVLTRTSLANLIH